MSTSTLGAELLKHLGGIDNHSLNEIVRIFSLDEDHQETFKTSNYYDLDSMLKSFQEKPPSLSVLSLNIEGLNAKFDKLTSFIKLLDKEGFNFSAIMLQETHLPKEINEESYSIPGYQTPIHEGYTCGCKGGLFIYLKNKFTYTQRKLHEPSKHWEGQFVDITHESLQNKVTLANIYRPPRDNYSNASIDRFLEPFSKIFDIIIKENSTLITGVDFNLDLLQLNEKPKYQEYFDLFCFKQRISPNHPTY